jgi:hypothetical protein
MTPERREEIDKQVMWAKISLSKENFQNWEAENLCPEEYFTGRDGILFDWCDRFEYLCRIDDCQQQNCRLKNEENSDSN